MVGENFISIEIAEHLPGLFRERVNRTPNADAFKEFDSATQTWQSSTWNDIAKDVIAWQQMLLSLKIKAGNHLAIMAKNGRNWVRFDQAALGLGCITVPLYVEDRGDNVAYILENADVALLVIDGEEQWQELAQCNLQLPHLKHIISLSDLSPEALAQDARLQNLTALLAQVDKSKPLITETIDINALASIVYTSGTTGKPKGVMLSHKNILSNAWSGLQCADVHENSLFLSFLPLSHMLERTVGYYMSIMAGSTIAYTRGIPVLGEDLQKLKPTVLISVPRIYERVYAKVQAGLEEKSAIAKFLFELTVKVGWQRFEFQQNRRAWFPMLLLWPLLNKLVAQKIMDRLGGRMEIAISGGAPLPAEIAKVFIGLGLPLLQGYGLTETSPVLTVNRPAANIPHSIGQALPSVQLRIGELDELQAKADCVMLGYWKNQAATQATFTDDGWLKTGDCARVDALGHFYITGRIKDILVLANGEKVPPADMEMAIALTPMIEHVMVVGEGRSHLTAVITLDPEEWPKYLTKENLTVDAVADVNSHVLKGQLIKTVCDSLAEFPGYAVIKDIYICSGSWTVENGLLTPTMKVKRPKILAKYETEINAMYEKLQSRHKK